MEIRVLKYFLAVAREQNITNAAEVLHITQPTLSRQLKELEDEIGKTLFIRGKRKITLTEDGRLFRKRAEEIVELVNKTESEFSNSTNEISGEIAIGGGETNGMRLIARTIKKLNINYPHIHYRLFSGNADDVTEKLDKGLLDFGLLIEPVDVTKYEYLQLPFSDTWVLLMRKDNPLAKKKFIEPDDLLDIPIICSRQIIEKSNLTNWLGNDFNKLNIISTYNLIFNASLMVDEGIGCAITLDKLVNTGVDSNLCFRPLKDSKNSNLIFVWKKYQIFSKAQQLFLEELQKEITPHIN